MLWIIWKKKDLNLFTNQWVTIGCLLSGSEKILVPAIRVCILCHATWNCLMWIVTDFSVTV